MVWKLTFAVILEVAYAIGTRVYLGHYYGGIELELYKTAIRGFTAIIYWMLFHDLIRSQSPRFATARRPLFGFAIVLIMLSPIITGDEGLPDAIAKTVFALTSIVVGLREEILYRGVLQNLLEKRMGWIPALIVSNVIFTLYHYGAQPFTPLGLTMLFSMGSILGLIYYGTRSLALVVAFHSIYDALWALVPFVSKPLPRLWGTCLEITALALLTFWAWRQCTPGKDTRR